MLNDRRKKFEKQHSEVRLEEKKLSKKEVQKKHLSGKSGPNKLRYNALIDGPRPNKEIGQEEESSDSSDSYPDEKYREEIRQIMLKPETSSDEYGSQVSSYKSYSKVIYVIDEESKESGSKLSAKFNGVKADKK